MTQIERQEKQEEDRAYRHQDEIKRGGGRKLLDEADDGQASGRQGQRCPEPKHPMHCRSQEGGQKDPESEEAHVDGADSELNSQVVDDARQEEAEGLNAEHDG